MFVHRRILMSENDGSSKPQGEVSPSTEADVLTVVTELSGEGVRERLKQEIWG
jgi:hypothetical protein